MEVKDFIPDVCIVGAGVAGAAMAAFLGKNGKRVCIIEKNWSEQDRIVGELLQPGGVQKLKEMGLDFVLEALDAQPVTGYAMFLRDQQFEISYPKENGNPATGYGFRNGKFVQHFRNYIQTLANVLTLEGTVNSLVQEGEKITGVNYLDANSGDEKKITAPLTIICEGPFSNLRDSLSSSEKKISGFFLGLVLHNCQLPYPNHGHVVVAEPSPLLLYPITSSETRVLIDFPGETPPRKSAELREFLLNKIGPQIPASILPSYTEAVEEGKFKVMPNHRLPAQPIFKNGAVLLGDSLNMRHPLTGGGMTVAFTDIQNLGTRLIAIDDFNNAGAVGDAIRNFYSSRHTNTSTINILADALYRVMRNEDLRDACYDYLKRGGHYAEEPISILSAISRDQKLLRNHFFAVALFGAKRIIQPFPSPKRIRRGYRMISDAVHIIDPLMKHEHPDLLTRSALRVSKLFF